MLSLSCIYIAENYNDWMQRFGQKTSEMPSKWGYPPFVNPQDFFQKSSSVTFGPLWCPNFVQKPRKN